MSILPCVEIEPKNTATATVIWLHGLGANGHDFVPIVPELNLPEKLAIRFIFPHAPSIPVSINGGYVMPAWYDILALTEQREINEQQFFASCQTIYELIDREIQRGIASERIILIGFSQGGAVAYQAALTYPKSLAGLLALSTYFIDHAEFVAHPANKTIPIQIFHGRFDSVVQESMGKSAYDALTQKGFSVNYKSYPMEHEVSYSEIADISAWLQQRLAI